MGYRSLILNHKFLLGQSSKQGLHRAIGYSFLKCDRIQALKFFPAMLIVPTMQISWTFFSIISGMLYFQEYKDFTLFNGIMFIVAVMV